MNIQWYPGHMTKARRMMQENIRLVDLVIELVDARVPYSSRNPDIDELGKNKARLLLLNKADLADEAANEAWSAHFREQGFQVVKLDSRSRTGLKAVQAAVQEACREKTERDRKRGILNRPVRAMVAGIPNVGKSTFINSFAGRACAKTGNKPGVTKGAQWVRLNKQVELLDTPGILWPRFEDQVGILPPEVDAPDRVPGDVSREEEASVGDHRAVDDRFILIVEQIGGLSVVRGVDHAFDRVAPAPGARDEEKSRQRSEQKTCFHGIRVIL